MPRLARLDAPGVLHHIMIRGIERRKIFRNDKDRDDFLDRLSTLLPKAETSCYAWAFLANHAHFLFRTGKIPLKTLMRRLLTGYAVSFNPAVGGTINDTDNSFRIDTSQLYVRRLFICGNWYGIFT